MNKFGMQYKDASFKGFPGKKGEHSEIRKILQEFHMGYKGRDVQKVDEFIDKLFAKGESTYALGTATGELLLGIEQVKDELIKSDWEYWGDVDIDWENARIDLEGEVAWFATIGSVKYTFEDTLEKYDRHVNLLKSKVEENGLTPLQKIAHMNWFLSLVYHQRGDQKREYLWPLRLSGMMVKDEVNWKIVNLKFSIPRTNFPDERFEYSLESQENYNHRNVMKGLYKSNSINTELKTLLKCIETEFIGQREISMEKLKQFFSQDCLSYVIAPENLWYEGLEGVKEFFEGYGDSCLSLDIEQAIALKINEITCVTVTGILKQNLKESVLIERAMQELDNLFQANITAKEKLFAAHRSIAYVLKESAVGESYTCPIRLTAIVKNGMQGPNFQNIHFSYPFYWILEGKLDGIKSEASNS